MPTSFEFVCPLPNGLHARPASHVAGKVGGFQSAVTLLNQRTGRAANGRSVLELVGTDTRSGDACRIDISGADEQQALTALQHFVAQELAACDEPLVAPDAAATDVIVPRSLLAAGLTRYHAGAIACRGLGQGRAVIARARNVPGSVAGEKSAGAEAELIRFEAAQRQVRESLEATLSSSRGPAAGITRAHLAILNDPALVHGVGARIRAGRSAAQAVGDTLEEQRGRLAAADSAYVRERVLDLEDIAAQLWEKLVGPSAVAPQVALTEPSVVFAATLTPSEFLGLDRQWLRGLVLEHAGQTSHAIILARSFGVPSVTGVTGATSAVSSGTTVLVDATLGIVVPAPAAGVERFYAGEAAKHRRMREAAATACRQEARTADGQRLEIGANIASVEEATAAFASGAEGIGLFRTELLFADRQAAPAEEEQYELYAAVVKAAGGRPVIIRTLDVGGDKPVPFLRFPAEANPFLGYRGVRFYAEHAGLMKTQLRAIIRAAAHGPVKILVPMISSVDEARLVRRLVDEAQAEVAAAGPAAPAGLALGFMLEVPSTAFLLDELCALADFFSLGTNDLAQYFTAADRENRRVAALNHPFQPAFLRLLQQLVSGVRARGRWIGLCGEMAENAAALPLLVGLGLDEISVAAPRIGAIKAALARLTTTDCAQVLQRALACGTRTEVDAALEASASPVPLLAPELVLDGVEAGSKAEVIRAMVNALHEAGRTAEPHLVEEAVWRREETYSTGFGEGFALPHGKTDALAANSIVVARLRTPVDWQAMDEQPVDVVILLAIRASQHGKVHMQTLARLSRLITREEFRAAVRAERSVAGILGVLAEAGEPRRDTAA